MRDKTTKPTIHFIVGRPTNTNAYASKKHIFLRADPMKKAYPSDGPNVMRTLFRTALEHLLIFGRENLYYYTESIGVLEVLWARRVALDFLLKTETKKAARTVVVPFAKLLRITVGEALLLLEKVDVKVLYCGGPRGGRPKDISALSPGSEREVEQTWGYLLSGTERCSKAVTLMVSKAELLQLPD